MSAKRYRVRLKDADGALLFTWEGPAQSAPAARAAALRAIELAWNAARHETARPQAALPWQPRCAVSAMKRGAKRGRGRLEAGASWQTEAPFRAALGPHAARISRHHAVTEAQFIAKPIGRAAMPWDGTWLQAGWDLMAESQVAQGQDGLLNVFGIRCDEDASGLVTTSATDLDPACAAALLAVAAGFAFSAPDSGDEHNFAEVEFRPRSATLAAGWGRREALTLIDACRPSLAWLANIGAQAEADAIRSRIASLAGERP